MEPVDVERYSAEAGALESKLAGALSQSQSGPDEQAVWEAYAGTEKLIAVMKMRLDYETPGVFTKLPEASDPAKLLADARELLSRAAGEISADRGTKAIETLRMARNDLRSYLTDKRKSATKRARSRPAQH